MKRHLKQTVVSGIAPDKTNNDEGHKRHEETAHFPVKQRHPWKK